MNSQWMPQIFGTTFRPVKNAIKLALKFFSPRLAERSENPYATHIPVLVGLPRLLNVRRVLELGCGEYSTLTFLDRNIFPNLEMLVSFENDPVWQKKIAALADNDLRVNLKLVVGAISRAVFEIDMQNFDLIFIDDSVTGEQRAETIREVIKEVSKDQIVVIHDYESKLYRQAARRALNHFRFGSLNPNTGVVWNQAAISKQQLRKLESVIKKNCKQVVPDDLKRWQRIFDQEL